MQYELILLKFRATISKSAYNLIVVQVKQTEPGKTCVVRWLGPPLGPGVKVKSEHDAGRTDKHSCLPQGHKTGMFELERRDVFAGLQYQQQWRGHGSARTVALCGTQQ